MPATPPDESAPPMSSETSPSPTPAPAAAPEALTAGFLLYPNLTQLDLTGAYEVIARIPGVRAMLVGKTMDPVRADTGLRLLPDVDFAACPQLDLICVPGGPGMLDAARDAEILAFLTRMAPGARYLTSVCVGSLILGAAGLLQGVRATCHWASHAMLARVGAIPVQARVVRDGRVFTGGGVTAGIDFGLVMAAEIAGEPAAKLIQLGLEYDPQPPFDAGSPARAGEALVNALLASYGERLSAREAAFPAR